MTSKHKRAVLYARKSTKQDRQEEQSASVSDQLDRSRAYAVDHGWPVAGEFNDDGRSGLLDRTKRPGLDAALKVIEAGDAEILVTLWTSRLSREERQRAEMLDVLDFLGTEWHAVADGGKIDRSTYAGYISYGIGTLFDVAYSKRVGENWRSAHQKRLDAGLPKSTSPRFGYRYKFDLTDSGRRVNGKYVVKDAEAEIVRELYRRYAKGGRGEGFTQLVRWLNADGWTVAGTGNPWTVRTLSRFMDSGFAAGFISLEEDLREVARGSHEAILTEAEWLAFRAQREKAATMGRKASGAGDRWWLAGLARCGACGGPMFVDSFKRTSSSILCSKHHQNPDSCDGVIILRAYVENAVGLWLGGHLDQLDALTNAESGESAGLAAATFEAAVAARDKVVDGLSNLEVNRALGDMEPAAYRRAKDKLTAKLAVAEKTTQEAASALDAPQADTDLLRGAMDRGWNPDERAALHAVLGRVEIDKDGLTIVPVVGEPARRTRAEMAPRCGVFGCERVHYTRGLCKSHTMKSRNLGGDLFEILVRRVQHGPVITVEEVEAVFAAAG